MGYFSEGIVYCNISSCGTCTNVTSTGGVIQSPNYPNDYGNNQDCLITIIAPPGNKIRLTFDRFNVEECCDKLTIYDGISAVLQLQFEGYVNPRPSLTRSNKLTVRFTSDFSNTLLLGPGMWQAKFTIEQIEKISSSATSPSTQETTIFTPETSIAEKTVISTTEDSATTTEHTKESTIASAKPFTATTEPTTTSTESKTSTTTKSTISSKEPTTIEWKTTLTEQTTTSVEPTTKESDNSSSEPKTSSTEPTITTSTEQTTTTLESKTNSAEPTSTTKSTLISMELTTTTLTSTTICEELTTKTTEPTTTEVTTASTEPATTKSIPTSTEITTTTISESTTESKTTLSEWTITSTEPTTTTLGSTTTELTTTTLTSTTIFEEPTTVTTEPTTTDVTTASTEPATTKSIPTSTETTTTTISESTTEQKTTTLEWTTTSLEPTTTSTTPTTTTAKAASYICKVKNYKVDELDNGICTNITSSEGIIRSPDYPNDYGIYRFLVYFIEVPPNRRISLTFSAFSLTNTFDFLYITDEITESSTVLISPLNGYITPPVINSTSNKMSIIFLSDVNGGSGYFEATFTDIKQTTEPTTSISPTTTTVTPVFLTCKVKNFNVNQIDNGICANITSSEGIIRSPNYGNGYGNFRVLVYFIEVPSNKKISLAFSAFNLEPGYDFIYITDETITSILASSLTGNIIPSAVNSTSNKMSIIFTSDYVVGTGNWEAKFTVL